MDLQPFVERLAIKCLKMLRLARRHRLCIVFEENALLDSGKHLEHGTAHDLICPNPCHLRTGLTEIGQAPLGVSHAKAVSDAVQSRLQSCERSFALLLRTPSFRDINGKSQNKPPAVQVPSQRRRTEGPDSQLAGGGLDRPLAALDPAFLVAVETPDIGE